MSITKYRLAAQAGLSALSDKERKAYGAAVSSATRKRHRAALLAYPSQARRDRTADEWLTMYRAAMVDKLARETAKLNMIRVDYVLKDGSRGTWDYEAPQDVDIAAHYQRELAYIDKCLDGKLKRLVFVTITETDTGTLELT